ncbi:PDR/VanB family oxidoreductase [Antarcticirhabdus aurantiaca]|uniref:PDR/VanB family oxidoreductase n=1 Tax=Antarcticirhabdus aurantiaca TaxID=2606717 RepID=UPI00131CBFA0|nr:PDR/VanB family oxidoreductase [Antarcticirhabdus aurantiaca]
MSAAKLNLVISAKRMLTPQICEFEFRDPSGAQLPGFEPGAHLNVATPGGSVRSYSISSDNADTSRYVIAVKCEEDGRGGSRSMVRETSVGDTLEVSEPSNAFPLVDAPKYLLVAGGIGITPILSMMRKLVREGHPKFRLVYCTRSAELTAYRDELSAPPFKGKVTIHHDGGDPDAAYDFWPDLETPDTTHVYCCGPSPLMDEIRNLTGHWSSSQIHFEDFAGVSALGADAKPFVVERASTGEVFDIPSDKSILEVVRERGYAVPSSCESGTCGSCRTKLVSGAVEHRDLVLGQKERRDAIMICVSRAAGDEKLVLDF